MSKRLMIRSESDDFADWSWTALDKENRPDGAVGHGDLNALAEFAKDKNVVLVIAGRSILITKVELPDANIRTISSAIPYAMEEQVAEDVEQLHFAHGARQNNGTIPVVAISKSFLIDLLRQIAAVDIYPIWAVAEPLLLPWDNDEQSVLIRNDKVIVRDGEISGFECTLNQLPVLMESREDKGESDLHIIRVWKQNDDVDIESIFSATNKQITTEYISSGYDKLTELGIKRPVINLLQGFDELDALTPSSGSWMPAIAMTILAAVLYLGASGYQYYSIEREINTVTQKTEELFRKTFPDVKRLVQPLVQAQQKLDQRKQTHGQGEDNLLSLIHILGQAKRRMKQIEFKGLEYRQQSMVIQLEGKSVTQIEQLKQQLEADGDATSEILSTVSRGDKVEARIRLKAKSA